MSPSQSVFGESRGLSMKWSLRSLTFQSRENCTLLGWADLGEEDFFV